MIIKIKIPQLGFSVSEVTLTEWLHEDGATVAQGQPLYVVETNKAQQEVESPVNGKLKIIAQTGEEYPVGAIVAEIEV
jgi:pyruvate/2-oxoglutarate dehydrogenase complex dihydrolipoamide acyltransferase (E2) component